jgi:zinc protease
MPRPLAAALLAALAAAAAAAPAGAQTPSAREIVERHVEAVGGRARLEAVRSRHLVYELNAGGMSLGMEVLQSRPNLIRTVISTPMGDMITGTDGRTVYALTPMGAEVMEGPQAEEVLARGAFDADFTFEGFELEVAGRAEHGGRACWNVRMRAAAGEMSRCFDVETGLMIAVTQTQGGTEVTSVVEEHREFDGIRYPARARAQAMGQEILTTLVSVDHAPLPADRFAVPSDVRP